MTNSVGREAEASLTSLAAPLGWSLPPNTGDRIAAFRQMLYDTNVHTNLTRIPESDFLTLHVLDCLAIGLSREYHRADRLIDVGTGAGLPGVLLAIASPQKEFLLIDARKRKIEFVQRVIAELGIENARAEHVRSEDITRSAEMRFDMALARATGALAHVLTITAGLVKRSGLVAAWKGPALPEEIAALGSGATGDQHRVIELILPGTDLHRSIALFRCRMPAPRRGAIRKDG